MKRQIYFCKSWFRAKKKPTEVWPEEKARAAHVGGRYYTVLVDSMEKPYCFLEITEKAVGVGFLDDKLRESLTYGFQEVESKRLFLTMATYREFDGDTDKVLNATSYMFNRDGKIEIRRECFSPRSLEVATSLADISQNYSTMPEFGEYDDLIRAERT